MASQAIPVVDRLHGDLCTEVVTPDPTFSDEFHPASIVQVCAGDEQSLVIVGVRPWNEQVDSVAVIEEGNEVQVAAWTIRRAPVQFGEDGDPFGAVARSLLWAAVVSLRRPMDGRRVVAAPCLAPPCPPPGAPQ